MPQHLTTKAVRFAFTGVLATGVHVLVAILFIEIILLVPPVANGIAFVVATVVSYIVNTLWSFSTSIHKRNLFRFGIVSIVGLFLSVVISGVAQYYGLHYLCGIGLVVCIVPGIIFILHNFWTYR